MTHVPMFDYGISNPPYQDAKNRPMFQYFQHTVDAISQESSLIYMARWWYGTTVLETFRDYMLYRPQVAAIDYYTEAESAQQVFDGVEIAGGLSIVLTRDTPQSSFTLTEMGTGEYVELPHGHTHILPIRASLIKTAQHIRKQRERLGLQSLFDRQEQMVNELKLTGQQIQALNPVETTVDTPVPDKQIMIYANVSGGKGGRSQYYLIDTPPDHTPKSRYTVGIGQSIIENEHRPLRVFQFPPHVYFGRSTVSLARLETQEEAENFQKYAESDFFELCLRLSLVGRMKTFGVFVPDFVDYTEANPYLDWKQDLDPQLASLFAIDLDVLEELR